ncbi:hypothetical protein ACIO93_44020 [Streptomyces sp. NPDC087903]|uniref:hypothetical protein n=1 Tax=Streptomyces sp. NPDC087903 TaxID=3365819 RepID=UPI0037FE3BB3
MRGHEASAGSGAAVMQALSDVHRGASDRYFYTGTRGWVDVRHFGKRGHLCEQSRDRSTVDVVDRWMTDPRALPPVRPGAGQAVEQWTWMRAFGG